MCLPRTWELGGRWWPKEHHIGKAALKDCVIEPKVNGRWYELDEDGTMCEWGKVLAWDPPRRVVLAWQLNAEFKYDADISAEVEVSFTERGPQRTQVDFEHRNLERFGAAVERLAKEMSQEWEGILQSFAHMATDRD